MNKNLTTIIALISLVTLVSIQAYIVTIHYNTKTKEFNKLYTEASAKAIKNSDILYSDNLEDELSKLSVKILKDSKGIENFFANAESKENIIENYSATLLKNNNIHNLIKRRVKRNKLDTLFNIKHKIKSLAILYKDKKINIVKKDKKQSEKKGPSIYLKTFYNESNNYIIEYDSYVHFLNKDTIIRDELKGLVTMILLSTIVIIASFVYTLYILKRQRKLSALKSEFIDNITHEFKTPLSVISVATSSLKNDNIRNQEDKVMDIVSLLEKQNKHLTNMISHVIDVSLLDRKAATIKTKLINVSEFIRDISESFKNEISKNNLQIDIDSQLSDGFKYRLDTMQITRVINNLLSNSVKYCTQEPQININLYSDERLHIDVSDNGIGIDDQCKKHVFSKFYRSKNPTNSKGLGLGLYIVKRIVENHKGDISIESNGKTGTTIKMSFPLN